MTYTRMQRERDTMDAMLRVYCRMRHGGDTLCPECTDLLHYAHLRLERCPFQEGKTTCAKCPVHCYRPDRRAAIRQVMRIAGPRMLLRHPWLTVRHYWDGRRKSPVKPLEKKAGELPAND